MPHLSRSQLALLGTSTSSPEKGGLSAGITHPAPAGGAALTGGSCPQPPCITMYNHARSALPQTQRFRPEIGPVDGVHLPGAKPHPAGAGRRSRWLPPLGPSAFRMAASAKIPTMRSPGANQSNPAREGSDRGPRASELFFRYAHGRSPPVDPLKAQVRDLVTWTQMCYNPEPDELAEGPLMRPR